MRCKHIYIIRHGRQNSRLCNVDVPLSEHGVMQSELLAERLKGERFDLFYTSTLLRAVETGDIINRVLGMDILRRKELNEIDWGALEGKTDDEIKTIAYAFMKDRMLRNSDLPFPGGECGEDVYKRALPIFREIEESKAGRILIVSHGGLIRAMISGLLGLSFSAKLAFATSLENTSITEFKYNTDIGLYTLERLNDYSHLNGHDALMRSSWRI